MPRFRFTAAAAISAALLAAASSPLTADALDGPAFSASPAELLETSGKIDVDAERKIQVLFESGHFLVDAEGRVERRLRLIYRVDSPSASESWSRVSESWHPWYQDAPEIRARVISANGREVWLDPSHLGEYSNDEDGPDVYGDRMSLRGPLPGIERGAIVEEQRIVRDREPQFGAGIVRLFVFGQKVPVHRSRLILEAPPEVPLRYRVHRLDDLKPVEETIGDRNRWIFDHGYLEGWDEDVSYAPGDVARRPVVRFSTGESWNAVASSYTGIVEERIAGSKLKKISNKVAGKQADRGETIARLLAYVHDQVRYTGVEFGKNSIVPSDPEQTLDRQFGDCKDKSTLLVALLREAGIEAHLALLNTGPGADVDDDLPGMGRFDHAIVFVPGSPAIWIDPTYEFARAGELPLSSQGRLALVATDATTGLTRTPRDAAAANLRREVREVTFSPSGAGTVVETTEVSGAFERTFRRSFSRLNEAGLREQLERYAESQYIADGLGAIEVSDPRDLEQPVRLTLEVLNSRKVWTTDTGAFVSIQVGALVRDLPELLEPDDSRDEEHENRTEPIELNKPYVVELRYVIEPPPGYALLSMPESSTRNFGPALMTQEYTESEQGEITVSCRFDTMQPVYSVKQILAVRRGLEEFYAEKTPRVVFQQVGEAHLEAGRIREALEEFRALVALFPDEPLYRTRVARAWLAAGLGASARREARRAVVQAPKSVVAQTILGRILAHDELGRKFVPGFDYDGALDAFQAAHAIDPSDFEAWGELAILLEHDSRGVRYATDSKMDAAIAEYQALRQELESEQLTTNLMAALLHQRRFEEIIALRTEVPRNDQRDALHMAALAATQGVDPALREASSIAESAEAYRSLLILTSDWLDDIREYEEAAALLAAGAKGSAESVSLLSRAKRLGRVRRYDEITVSMDTPDGLAWTFFQRLIEERNDGVGRVHEMFDSRPDVAPESQKFTEVLTELQEILSWTMMQGGISSAVLLDGLLTVSEFTVEGDAEGGFRVRVRTSQAANAESQVITLYMVRTDSGLRLIGFEGWWGMVGRRLLEWLDQGEIERARAWLDWMVEDTLGGGTDDVLGSAPLQWIWTPGEPGDADRIRLAAASLMVDESYEDQPISILEQLRDTTPEGDPQVGLDLALIYAGVLAERHDVTLDAATRLLEEFPRSTAAFVWRTASLFELERYDEAERAIEERRKKRPGEIITRSLYAEIPHLKGDLKGWRERLSGLILSGRASSTEYNNLAWLDIVEDKVSDETLQVAQEAVSMTDFSETSSLHTLATVYAEAGHLAEARDVLLALIGERTSNELESVDWYTLGRIAEHYGATEEAIRAYEKVEPTDSSRPDSTSTHAIAARRLGPLKSKSRSGKK